MKYNPDIHHRCSIRLKDYDYLQEGAYFVTVCVNGRECLLGDVVGANPCIRPNDVGIMIDKWWQKLSDKYDGIEIDEYCIMPNHFHGIVCIVGADLCVCPNSIRPRSKEGEHIGSPLHRIIQWFKTMTTNEYIRGVKSNKWKPFDRKLWQRNYYEHVIRNDKELNDIREYIMNNPMKWEKDADNPLFVGAPLAAPSLGNWCCWDK